jgi:phosphoglycolate phosphatase-like HAD superfamily hydrolase
MPTKKKIIIFDLDGVLINSISNMEVSWNLTCKKFDLKIKFTDYKKNIGLPFKVILKNLNISKKINLIKKYYDKCSTKNIDLIKLYPNVKKTILSFKKKNFLTAIITSKDKRTKKILSKFDLKFDYVYSPSKSIKPKPYPDQIIKILSKEKILKKNCYYVGDMDLDSEFAKNAKIKFIFAKYGYEVRKIKKKYEIKKFEEIKKIIK